MSFNQDPESNDQSGNESHDASAPGEESNNRTFIIAAGALGGLVLLSLICMGAYVLFFAPGRNAAQATQQAQINANNTQVAGAFTQTAQVLLFTPTLQSTDTPTPSVTPLIAQASSTPVPPSDTPDPLTMTVAALYTQAAIITQTVVPASTGLSTALAQPSQVPATGFADEVGLPGLMVLAVVLVGVIMLARRMRSSPVR
jgi:hypothetical protein